MVLVLHGYAAPDRRRALAITVAGVSRAGQGQSPLRAYDQWIVCTPRRPSLRASASVSSNWRPGTYGPRSTTCVRTRTSLKEMKTRAPHGRVGWATPSVSARRTLPQAVRRPNAAGPLEPASATYEPSG